MVSINTKPGETDIMSRSYLLQYFFSSLKQLLGTQTVKRILAFFRFHPTINEIAEIKEGLSSS